MKLWLEDGDDCSGGSSDGMGEMVVSGNYNDGDGDSGGDGGGDGCGDACGDGSGDGGGDGSQVGSAGDVGSNCSYGSGDVIGDNSDGRGDGSIGNKDGHGRGSIGWFLEVVKFPGATIANYCSLSSISFVQAR